VSLAIFDLDNTLLAGDSDYLWGQFLVEHGLVERLEYEETNSRFYRDYDSGKLDIASFLRFALKPLADHEPDALFAWRERFVDEKVRPILLPEAQKLVNRHRRAGDLPVVVTATNSFVTEPIVKLYGIEHLIATTPEFVDGRFTGNFVGTPCFQRGKVTRLQEWLLGSGHDLTGSWFYSDSNNDEPLLSLVDNPVAVDPDSTLAEIARARGWPMISLR
jgi:HAD superfamily hydrolase (TIGR01490 family)